VESTHPRDVEDGRLRPSGWQPENVNAVAQAHEALLWTQNADFDGLEGVEYQPRAAVIA